MSKIISLLLFVCLLTSVGCSPEATSNKKLKVLIITGMNNHDWQKTTPALENLYHDSGRFDVSTTENPSSFIKQMLSKFDIIVSNWTNYPDGKRLWGEEFEKSLIDFVNNGKGFVVFHASSVCFHDWLDFQRIIGATWKENQTDHGDIHTFQVIMEDNKHPITKDLETFGIKDELWHRMDIQPDARVLCSAYSGPEHGGSGHYEPVAFTTSFGRGRGFNLVLGHDTNAMANPAWKMLMLNGTEWAATGRLASDI